ncbi:hypothetical protein NDU88_006991 [Pleurodeles waltl]|uniref:Uncharacterized protein n=1 Tax=Pleurodeles waltl TaxID=8319 RepID=A0AAV7PSV2_PLEWA|nr:hypothetical protein NDU88_006991 [Pleurodeles waltl]
MQSLSYKGKNYKDAIDGFCVLKKKAHFGVFPLWISVADALRSQHAGDLKEGGWGQSQHKLLAGPGAFTEERKHLKLLRGPGERNKVLLQLMELPDQSLDGELGKGADKVQLVKRMKQGGSERHLLRPWRSCSIQEG